MTIHVRWDPPEGSPALTVGKLGQAFPDLAAASEKSKRVIQTLTMEIA